MWKHLKQEQKDKYRTLITNFASLSSAFSQKVESEDKDDIIVAPIVNSKFQETVFQRAFNAVGEDIANTSFDASVVIDDNHKYLVGIKSFGIKSGDQKVAQFKKDSKDWTDLLQTISFNADISDTKELADERNHEHYRQLALEIARLRNQRIESSKAQIKGFSSQSVSVKSVYHVLMPTAKGVSPEIFVGETSYLPIDTENLEIKGATSLKTPTNFYFTDGRHKYKYTAADSQLHMAFENQDIVVDRWPVHYVEDPFYIFENLHQLTNSAESDVLETVSWVITDKKGQVESYSGFNAFNGGNKLAKKDRRGRIDNLCNHFMNQLSAKDLQKLKHDLEELLLSQWSSKEDKANMVACRDKLMAFVRRFGNADLTSKVEKIVYRPVKEVYIPLPDSKNFHKSHPDFFGKAIGTFVGETPKLALPKEKRTFQLKFLSSGDVIEAYINQDYGKGIQSFENQSILGDWLLRGVFQLKEREVLTGQKLEELGINGIRLSKFRDGMIGLDFIWIDKDNPPKDAIGWVSKQTPSSN